MLSLLIHFVDEEDHVGAPVEDSCDRVVPFLATGVPKLKLKEPLAVNLSRDGGKLSPDRHFVVVGEGVAADSLDYAALADSRVANENELKGSIKALRSSFSSILREDQPRRVLVDVALVTPQCLILVFSAHFGADEAPLQSAA